MENIDRNEDTLVIQKRKRSVSKEFGNGFEMEGKEE
jgi:hypothetical protein